MNSVLTINCRTNISYVYMTLVPVKEIHLMKKCPLTITTDSIQRIPLYVYEETCTHWYTSLFIFCWKYFSDDRFFVENIFLTTVFLLKISFWQLFFVENIFLTTVFFVENIFLTTVFFVENIFPKSVFCWKYLSDNRSRLNPFLDQAMRIKFLASGNNGSL